MQKYGIFIGVSNYSEMTKLRSAIFDAKIMADLYKLLNPDSKILLIIEEKTGIEIKNEIARFISEIQDSVDELFFFFSGHGVNTIGQPALAFKDYAESKKNEESLSSRELDALLTSKKTKLVVKVIDACNSGVNYFNSSDCGAVDENGISQNSKYDKVINMYSSQRTQSSFTSKNCLSDFTNSWIQSATKTIGIIRYMDIKSRISDEFKGVFNQTPLYSGTETSLELFGNITKEVQDEMSLKKVEFNREICSIEQPKEVGIVEKILKANKEIFFDKEKTYEIIDELLHVTKECFKNNDLSALYDISVNQSEYANTIPSCDEIGRWISKNKDLQIYANIQWGEEDEFVEEYKELPPKKGGFAGLSSMFGPQFKLEKIRKSVPIISGFIPNVQPPIAWFRVVFEPKVNFVKRYYINIVPLYSCTRIYLFHKLEMQTRISWEYFADSSFTKYEILNENTIDKDNLIVKLKGQLKIYDKQILDDLNQDYKVNIGP